MFFLLVIVAFLLVIGIPVGLSILIYKFIKKRDYDRRLRVIALIPTLVVGYLIYPAIYPNEDFYREDFKEVTGVDLPENAEFEYRTATFPDHFGDYTSLSIIKVGNDFYEKLPNQLIEKGLLENQEKIHSKEFDQALDHTNGLMIEMEFSLDDGAGFYYYVGFLSDSQTIIVKLLSW